MTKFFNIMISLLFVFTSCDANENDGLSITADVSTVQVPAEGGNFSISVTSSMQWEAVADNVEWCTLTNNSHSGSASFNLKITSNTGRDPRNATINIKEAGGDVFPVTVNQVGRVGEEIPAPIDVDHVPGERIPTVAWYGVYNTNSDLDARYKELKECGFTTNLADFGSSDASLAWYSLEVAKDNGVKTYIETRAWENASPDLKNRIKKHPALAGYYIKDEPGANEYAALNETVKKLQAFDDQHLCYINLFGNGATKEQTHTNTYTEYVQRFVQEIPTMPYISFDHYSIYLKDGVRELDPIYYENYRIVYEEAKKANRHIWGFTLSVAHFNFPIQTLSDMRLQVYTALAYGAQSIQFFTYWTPPLEAGADFSNAPIDLNGNKTATYYVVKEMNTEIKNLSKVFLNAKTVWAAHTGVIPQGCIELDKSDLPDIFESLDISGGKGALVSYMQKGDDNFLIVVNHDVHETINVKSKGKDGLCRIKKDGSVVLEDERIHSVTPGDLIVYFWKNK